MNYDNIVEISKFIQKSMIEFQENNPDNTYEHLIRDYVLRKTMQFTKGKCDPTTIKSLICMEKSIFNERRIIFNGCLQC